MSPRDSTEHARSEAPLTGQLADILERVSDAFVALDRNWRYTYVNRRAAALFGRQREDLIGKHIWTEIPDRKQAEQEARRSEEILRCQNRVLELIARGTPLHDTLAVLVRGIESLW